MGGSGSKGGEPKPKYCCHTPLPIDNVPYNGPGQAYLVCQVRVKMSSNGKLFILQVDLYIVTVACLSNLTLSNVLLLTSRSIWLSKNIFDNCFLVNIFHSALFSIILQCCLSVCSAICRSVMLPVVLWCHLCGVVCALSFCSTVYNMLLSWNLRCITYLFIVTFGFTGGQPMVTADIDSYYPMLVQYCQEGYLLTTFYRVPFAGQMSGFGSVVVPYQAVFCKPDDGSVM